MRVHLNSTRNPWARAYNFRWWERQRVVGRLDNGIWW